MESWWTNEAVEAESYGQFGSKETIKPSAYCMKKFEGISMRDLEVGLYEKEAIYNSFLGFCGEFFGLSFCAPLYNYP